MDSTGPKDVRLREKVHHYILQSYLLLFWTGKFMNLHAFPVLDIAQWELRVGMHCYDGGYVSQELKLVIPFVL